MSDWRGRDDDDTRKAKIAFAVGAGAGAIVIVWIMLARGGGGESSGADSRGFSFGAPAAPAGPAPLPERRTESGLSMVRLGDVGDDASSPASAAPAAPPPAPSEELRALGVDVQRDPPRLGAQKGLLSSLAAKALEHPSALRHLLNNKTLVDAYFSRDLVRKNCSSGAALKSYLMNGSDPSGVSEEVGLAKTFLARPEAASAAAGTEFAKRLMDCPSVGQLAKDPGAALAVAGANPQLLGLLSDPNAVKALAGNPQASSLFHGVQSSLGGAR